MTNLTKSMFPEIIIILVALLVLVAVFYWLPADKDVISARPAPSPVFAIIRGHHVKAIDSGYICTKCAAGFCEVGRFDSFSCPMSHYELSR